MVDKPADTTPEGQRQVRIHMDERDMKTSYANAFRTNSTPDEVLLDFGFNLPMPPAAADAQAEILFKLDCRVVMNYYSAKRLALTLTQMIRRHEEQFGELELDPAKRQKGGK
ncbi:MAG: DUF3467 domain-containing protein [Planctomycetota bacterium]